MWTCAAHRTLFLPGALQLVCAIVLMAWEIGGRSLGLWAPPQWVFPPAWTHAYLMLFALFPWFVFGFAMTAMPKWTHVEIRRGEWLACALPMIAGVLLFHAGLATSRALVLAGGVLHLAGWCAGAVSVARIAFTSERRDPQAMAISVLLFVGVVLGGIFLAGMWREDAAWIAIAGSAAPWLFLLPVFLVVNHRMIPFFSSRVLAGYVVVPAGVFAAVPRGGVRRALPARRRRPRRLDVACRRTDGLVGRLARLEVGPHAEPARDGSSPCCTSRSPCSPRRSPSPRSRASRRWPGIRGSSAADRCTCSASATSPR